MVGKIVTYHMEERERVKIVDYATARASHQADQAHEIDEQLREKSVECASTRSSTKRKIRQVKSVLAS